MIARILAAVALSAAPAVAAAEAFEVRDLGPMPDRARCMERAQAVLEDYRVSSGSPGWLDNAGNMIFGWDLYPGDQDLVLTCPIVAGGVNAFLTIHGADTPAQTRAAADAIEGAWVAWGTAPAGTK